MPTGIYKHKKGYFRPKFSEEWRKNLSKAHKGQFWSKKSKKKLSKSISGKKNVNWKGNKVGYRGIHHWVNKHLGTPKQCKFCLKNNLIGHKIHWANKSGKYLRKKNDWIRLCVKCHKIYDLAKKYGIK